MYRNEPKSQRNRQIVAELRNGAEIMKLCEKYGATHGNVTQLKQRYVNTPTRLPHERKKFLLLQELKYSGLTIKAIAQKYKMSATTVNMLKKAYFNTKLWNEIPMPSRSPKQGEGEILIEKTWEKDRCCSGCGREGSIRINIQNRKGGIGISLCKCCLIYIKNEVIEGLEQFGDEANVQTRLCEVPVEEVDARELETESEREMSMI